MPRVYIHEFVDVDGTKRAEYQHHMTANWSPEAGELRKQLCFGVFSVVGSTGRWPQVLNLWEYESWDALGHNFEVELSVPGHRDPMLAEWWEEAAKFRRGGVDRILVAHPDSPGIEDHQRNGGTGAVAYTHELISCSPGTARSVCDAMVDASHDLALVGAWTTAMRAHDEVVVMRAVETWEQWAGSESADAASAKSLAVPESVRTDVVRLERILVVDAELSPLRTGRQPLASDRRPI
jgi:hypothetical protein